MSGIGKRIVTKSVTAQNQFTDPIAVQAGDRAVVQVDGTISATVMPQMIMDNDTVYFDFGADSIAASGTFAGYKAITAPTSGQLRAGVKTGGYTSGSGTVKVIVG